MCSHVQSVPGEERPRVVNHICLYYVRVVKLIPPRDGALDCASFRRRADETQFSLNVCLLFFAGESSPEAQVSRDILPLVSVPHTP